MPGVQSVGRWGNVMGGQDFTNDTYVEGVPITNAVVQGEGRNLSFGISVEADRSVPGRDQRHRRDVQRPGRLELRRQVGHEHVPRQRLRVLPQQGARHQGVLRRHEAGRQPARVRRHARRSDSQEPDVLLRRLRRLPRSPADARRGWSRFRRAAQRNGDFSALPVVIYDPATTRPNPNGTGFVRDPFPGNIIPQDRISPISQNFQSFLPDPTERRPAEQLSRRPPADRVQQRQRHRQSGPAS